MTNQMNTKKKTGAAGDKNEFYPVESSRRASEIKKNRLFLYVVVKKAYGQLISVALQNSLWSFDIDSFTEQYKIVHTDKKLFETDTSIR